MKKHALLLMLLLVFVFCGCSSDAVSLGEISVNEENGSNNIPLGGLSVLGDDIIDAGRMIKELSAEELEAACRKTMRIEVTKVKVLTRILDGMGIAYRLFSETQVDIFERVNISQLTLALAKEDCEVLSAEAKTENLESFFISLTGGGSHAQAAIR